MDWGSLAGELAAMGASSETINTALDAARQSESRLGPTGVADLNSLQKQMLLEALSRNPQFPPFLLEMFRRILTGSF